MMTYYILYPKGKPPFFFFPYKEENWKRGKARTGACYQMGYYLGNYTRRDISVMVITCEHNDAIYNEIINSQNQSIILAQYTSLTYYKEHLGNSSFRTKANEGRNFLISQGIDILDMPWNGPSFEGDEGESQLCLDISGAPAAKPKVCTVDTCCKCPAHCTHVEHPK